MISIVVSVFNEEDMLREFMESIEKTISFHSLDAEIIFVNDGSNDNSIHILKELQNKMPNLVRIIDFSRNFGHEAAMIAGIDFSKGDMIICMDSDLQHPPSLIPLMVDKFNEGYHIVSMIREKREDNSWIKNKFSNYFYRLINKLSEFKLEENASDFFLISAQVATILRENFRERNRFLRGFIQIVGFKKTTLNYVAPKRNAGESKYSFFKLLTLSANAIIAFTKLPLFLGIYIGGIFALFSVIIGLFTLEEYIFGNTPPSGYTTIVLFLSLSFSVLFILVGIIGTYVGYIFDENKARPIYIIKEVQ